MAEEPQQQRSGAPLSLVRAAPARPGQIPSIVAFDRKELALILNLYGRKVAEGEWRDYAMDFLRDRALFSIYRRNSERPLYVVEKNPRLSKKQGMYAVTGMDGRTLNRGHDLDAVLRVLARKLVLVR
jgi:hypothetical protein